MLQIFYDSQDFFLLKELEKQGPTKGVISQSIKDVLQSLVDDDLVFKDKIGTSVYFWSLPSRAVNQLSQTRSALESKLERAKKRRLELETRKEESTRGRENSSGREQALKQLKEAEAKSKALKDELARFADNDPAALEAMKSASKVMRDAANRWTDNIFSLQSWCANNFEHMREALAGLYKEIGIPEEFDYLETEE
ncbi:Meiotic nuclear division protein [Klebsormidium nitens]|uniref:Meiotic nuclear division protein 1 homolog n=1 Tax=Klebsormidium nitens TaxID=105231 RepID=A0A0U9HJV1_KLENI|nr:Meiotic nuclear division protein [Klebsormidium nitens]|eukprot:GAQ82512.1 Meiotic nuclear division protein [Klebsormidium nitens]